MRRCFFAYVSSLARPRLVRSILGLIVLAFAMPASVFPSRAQVSYTAADSSDSGFGPLNAQPPQGTKPEDIVQRFAAKESQFRQALEQYTWRQDVRIQTLDGDNKVDGEYHQVYDVTFDGQGRRAEIVVFAPQNTLERIQMTPNDIDDIEHRLPFVLTTQNLTQYDITYKGQQKVDEVDTYVFDIKPKVIEKKKRYLQGRIWVDQQDLQILVVSGKNVPDDLRPNHEDLSPPFTTYRQQVDGKYWFPTYTKGDGILKFSAGKGFMGEEVHIRQVIKYSDYKQYGSSIRMIYEGESKDAPSPTPPTTTPASPSQK